MNEISFDCAFANATLSNTLLVCIATRHWTWESGNPRPSINATHLKPVFLVCILAGARTWNSRQPPISFFLLIKPSESYSENRGWWEGEREKDEGKKKRRKKIAEERTPEGNRETRTILKTEVARSESSRRENPKVSQDRETTDQSVVWP